MLPLQYDIAAVASAASVAVPLECTLRLEVDCCIICALPFIHCRADICTMPSPSGTRGSRLRTLFFFSLDLPAKKVDARCGASSRLPSCRTTGQTLSVGFSVFPRFSNDQLIRTLLSSDWVPLLHGQHPSNHGFLNVATFRKKIGSSPRRRNREPTSSFFF